MSPEELYCHLAERNGRGNEAFAHCHPFLYLGAVLFALALKLAIFAGLVALAVSIGKAIIGL